MDCSKKNLQIVIIFFIITPRQLGLPLFPEESIWLRAYPTRTPTRVTEPNAFKNQNQPKKKKNLKHKLVNAI